MAVEETATLGSERDIVLRLRQTHRTGRFKAAAWAEEAADEIESLRSAVTVLLGEADNPWPLDMPIGGAVHRAMEADRG